MPKITEKNKKPGRQPTDKKTIIAKTTDKSQNTAIRYNWWQAQTDNDLVHQTIATANYLQKTQQYRIKGASIFSRIYSGKGLMNYALNSKILDTSNQLPVRRPTMNVSQSCVDTLVSRITQVKPKPTYLTEGGNYKQQKLAMDLDQFIAGELYRTKAYDKGKMALRDACVFGDGFIKVFEKDKKVSLEKTIGTELYADKDDSWYGDPRQLFQFKLCDRNVLAGMFPDAKIQIQKAEKAYVDGSGESSETISDQVIVVEAWHLPSFDGATDGRKVIVCSDGVIDDDKWDKPYFPFVKMPYNPHSVGYFSQGLVEMLMGTQLGIDGLLRTISESIHRMGAPVIWVDELSKIMDTSFNNNIGTIAKYRGTLPTYLTPQCVAPEMYEHLMRLIGFAYQIAGVSQLAASGVKPAGLNSGEAQREYLQTQDDRFNTLDQSYTNMYNELAFMITDKAAEIVKRDGSYTTVYPGRDGMRELDFPDLDLVKDTYTIQCYDESSLPRDPSGRQAKLSEMLASGEITLQTYRRLSSFPDIAQNDKLANALENRITKILDGIVWDGDRPEVDQWLLSPDDLAMKISTQYINLYAQTNLEEKKIQRLRDFQTQYLATKQSALPPPPPPQMPPGPQGQGVNAAPPPAPAPVPNSVVSAA